MINTLRVASGRDTDDEEEDWMIREIFFLLALVRRKFEWRKVSPESTVQGLQPPPAACTVPRNLVKSREIRHLRQHCGLRSQRHKHLGRIRVFPTQYKTSL